ncbi:hypothetical protein ACIBIZ_48395 [Nonomuraea spiralis]|uniref:hypothetical protein n=1 Tax=Nonomuraea TaxID=83681 RepID=UPI000F7736EF|nr:hypothetical protein [Nonomuraea sp. WAC 01424]
MLFSRIGAVGRISAVGRIGAVWRVAAGLLAAAVVATGGGLAAPGAAASVLRAPACKYRVVHVRTWLNVRAVPRGRIVDRLYPGDHSRGSCRRFDGWRRSHGTEHGRRGYSFSHYLKKFRRH